MFALCFRFTNIVGPPLLVAISCTLSCTDSDPWHPVPASTVEKPDCSQMHSGGLERFAKNADEAWHERPAGIPPVRRDELLAAVAIATACEAAEYSSQPKAGFIQMHLWIRGYGA